MLKYLIRAVLLAGLAWIVLGTGAVKEKFYKGNLHTHSYWSDGNTFPEEVAWWYKSQGYDFLAVTDHNILQEGDKWIQVDRNETIRRNYADYLEHFGGVGVQTEDRDGQLYVRLRTLREYRADFERSGDFLLINSEEVTDAAEGRPVHLNAIHTTQLIQPAGGESVDACLKANVVRMRSHLTEAGNPEWIIVNHPNFGWALTAQRLADSGARFFEVFNGHPSVRNYGDAEHPGTEMMWDEANRIRLSRGEPLLLGVATDDSHHFLEFGVGRANPGRGATLVRAAELTPAALYESMTQGDFYASTGVMLDDFSVTDRGISIRISGEKGVSYRTEFIALRSGEKEARVVQEEDGTRVKYRFSGDESFVRARIVSSKEKDNPYAAGDVEVAWLQPVTPGR